MRKLLINAAIVGLLALPTASWATNGYWSTGYGTKSKAIAGACVAMRFGAMCAAANPGSLVFVGSRVEAGLAVFSPSRGFTANDDMESPPENYAFIPPGEYESENEHFLIPHFAYNHMINERSSIGVAIGANGGMNTEYGSPDNPNYPFPAIFSAFNPSNQEGMNQLPGIEQFDATSPTGVDLMQLFIGVTYSYKLNENHGVGITPIFAIQSMEVQGLEPFKMFSKHPDYVTGNGRDISYGGGLRVGWSGEIAEGLILGASYQTELWMSRFDEYKGLFAEEGKFNTPANLDLGFSYKFAPKWTFAFGYQRIFYGDIKAVSNRSDIVFSSDRLGPDAVAMMSDAGLQVASGMGDNPALGSDNGLGFGWDDLNVLKFGLQWEYSPTWTFRAGYSHAGNTFEGSQALFNIIAPATVKDHYTFGFSHAIRDNHEISFAFTYADNKKVYGTNPNTGPQTGYLEMNQWEAELGWSMKF